jgi:hypothetical protein
MSTNFPELLRILVRADVEFIIVGGAAARAFGSTRLTEDLDVVYRRSSENIERVCSALAPYHPYLRGAPLGLPFDWSPQTIKNGLNFTLTVDLGAIDLLGNHRWRLLREPSPNIHNNLSFRYDLFVP